MAVLIERTKEKLQEVIDELSELYGNVYSLRVETVGEYFENEKLMTVDKIFIEYLEEIEVE